MTRRRISKPSKLITCRTAFWLSVIRKNAEYWKDENAQEILSAYVANMNSRGYTRVEDREEADLGLQVSYVRSTYYFTDYGRPEWWWNYPATGMLLTGATGADGIIPMP